MHKLITVFLLLAYCTTVAQEASPWTLKKCIQYALEHNTSIAQNRLQGEIAENNLLQSKINRLPAINGNGNHNYNIGRTIDPFTNSFNNTTIQSNSFSIGAGVLLYGGSQVNHTINQNKSALLANQSSLAVIRNQIALSVSQTFLQIIQGEENLKSPNTQYEITQSQLKQAEIFLENGSTNAQLVLNLKAQSANDKVNIINAQNTIERGYNTLMNLMQYPIDQSFEIHIQPMTYDPSMRTESVADIYTMALQNLPDIAQAEAIIAQNKYAEKMASARLQPTISGYGNINTVYSQSGQNIRFGDTTFIPIGFTENSLEQVLVPNVATELTPKSFGDQLTDNLGQQVGLSISIPIFNGYRNQTALKNARLNTKISELNLQNTKNQIRNDVTTAYTNLKTAESRYLATKQSVEAQQLNYAYSQKRFDAGILNSVELLTAKNQWNQAQIQWINAKYEWLFRNLIIDFYKGKELSL